MEIYWEECERMEALPPGYSRVRFKRSTGAWVGSDKRVYGPYRESEVAVVETVAARVLEALGAAEVLERGPEPRTPDEIMAGLPEDLRSYLKLAGLDPAGDPTPGVLPGSAESTYMIPVRDEGTGEVLKIVYPWPRTVTGGCRITAVTNKKGESVLVVALAEGGSQPEIGAEEAKPPRELDEFEEPPEVIVRRVYKDTGDPRRALEYAPMIREGLKIITEEKLRKMGYRILRIEEIPREIRVAGLPDFVAVKDGRYVVVEVRPSGRLKKYSSRARIILVTDLEEGGRVEVWGMKELTSPRELIDPSIF